MALALTTPGMASAITVAGRAASVNTGAVGRTGGTGPMQFSAVSPVSLVVPSLTTSGTYDVNVSISDNPHTLGFSAATRLESPTPVAPVIAAQDLPAAKTMSVAVTNNFVPAPQAALTGNSNPQTPLLSRFGSPLKIKSISNFSPWFDNGRSLSPTSGATPVRAQHNPRSGNGLLAPSDASAVNAAAPPNPPSASPQKNLSYVGWFFLGSMVLAIIGLGRAYQAQYFQNAPESAHQLLDADHDEHDHDEHDHDEHDHDAHHEEGALLALSPQAQANIGLKLSRIEPGIFERTITMPATVKEIPGVTHTAVPAPIGGIVTDIRVKPHQVVQPGDVLFTIQLNDAKILEFQEQLLRNLASLDLADKELSRQRKLYNSHVIAKAAFQKTQSRRKEVYATVLTAKRALTQRGLSETQVKQMVKTRKLAQGLESFDVRAPGGVADTLSVVSNLNILPGQQVNFGDALITLGDYRNLYIEGSAFARERNEVLHAAQNGWGVSVSAARVDAGQPLATDLKIIALPDEFDAASKTYAFSVAIPNEVVGDVVLGGERQVAWDFMPGQPVNLHIPIERLEGKMVLPAEAVVRVGAESYVFVPDDHEPDHFRRIAVRVAARNAHSVVLVDGSLEPGSAVVVKAAQQMQMHLRLTDAGPVDPHAGHDH